VRDLDSRRLTGPNLHSRSPGAVVTLSFDDDEDPAAFIDRWRAALGRGLAALGWTADVHVRCWQSEGQCGAELMFTASVDRLYAATDLNDWAIARARGEPEPDAALVAIAESARSEQAQRDGLLELLAAADARAVPWLLDDDEVSLGYFDQCLRWRLGHRCLPGPDDVDWSRFDPVAGPGRTGRQVALITGTNGKTTTTRLLARIARLAGLHVGNTSTDGLYVDEQLVDAGDWTGPGGARAVLRNPAVEMALLEAARGGLLRRGAGVRSVMVAVITNVAHDHLGEYGIVDLDGMAAAKGVIATIAVPQGRVVLGADSPALVTWAQARQLPAPVVWFSLDPNHPVLAQARRSGAEVWTVVDGDVVRIEGAQATRLCRADELPISLGGLARHNIANALAAAAAARGLGFDDATILAGLREFGARADDNPGRARVCEVARPGGGRVRVLLDFAHNLAGVAAITELVRGLGQLPSREAHGGNTSRPIVCFGMPGDRSDEELRTIAAALTSLDPRQVILRELPDYARGRDPAEVPRLLERGLRAVSDVPIAQARDEIGSLELALAQADAGGLVVMLVHTERDAVEAWLREHDVTALG
jgi:UDP-N-acetylmuramyl tripeptide synthase